MEEIRSANKQLKKGKYAGPDSIPAEALKTDNETSVELLYSLSKGEIVHGSDRNPAHHYGTIPGVEFAVVCQLY